MDTDSFVVYEIEAKKFLHVEIDSRGYSKDNNKPVPMGKNTKVIGMLWIMDLLKKTWQILLHIGVRRMGIEG